MSWFALMTTPQSEFKAVSSIERMGVSCVCPVVIERRVRHRRSATIKQEISKPLFCGYIFVEMGYLPSWIFQEKHIVRPLTSPIPDHLMVSALARSGKLTVDEWNEIKRFAAGDTIRRKGDKSGLNLTVLSVDDQNLVALASLFGKTHRETFALDQIEAAE